MYNSEIKRDTDIGFPTSEALYTGSTKIWDSSATLVKITSLDGLTYKDLQINDLYAVNLHFTTAVFGGSVTGNWKVLDDALMIWGTTSDIVGLNRSTVLNANTALASVLIGTPVAQALAANSFMLSNVTASGDIALYANLGGHSQQFFFYDTSASTLWLLMNKLSHSTGAFAF
jgi:hypothetical protein